MNKFNLLESLIAKVTPNLNIGEIGTLEKNISKKIDQYKPNNKLLDNIIVFHDSKNRIIEISFFGEDFKFSLKALNNTIKKGYRSNYSFRDNITKITFGDDESDSYIVSILDNKVIFDNENFTITDEYGNSQVFDLDYEHINHLSFHFKYNT